MNLEWQNPNTEIPKPAPVEKTETIENEQSFEQELSPEQIDQIMAKVQNINKIGTAYTSPKKGLSDIDKAFKYGILGNGDSDASQEEILKNWTNNVRTKKEGVVFFNIVGTETTRRGYSKEGRNDEPAIEESYFFNHRNLAIIFDLSKYKAEMPYQINSFLDNHNTRYGKGIQQKLNTFRYGFGIKDLDSEHNIKPNKESAYKSYLKDKKFYDSEDKNGFNEKDWQMYLPYVPTEEGFTLSFRVAPRSFRGIVVRPMRKLTDFEVDEEYKSRRRSMKDNLPQQTYDEMRENIKREEKEQLAYSKRIKAAEEIASKMREIFGERAELLLPIYDSKGNLLWPKRMSYEEVKKFVVEREAENTNKEEK